MLPLQAGGGLDRVVLVDEGQDALHRRLVVAERPQRQRHGLIHDLEHAAARELLVLHQRDVGFDAGGVTVHQERDRAGGGEHRGLSIAVAMLPTTGEHLVPHLAGGIVQILRARRVDLLDRIAVHLHHAEHWLPVGGEALERSHRRGELGAGAVGNPMQDRRNRPTEPAAGVAIVGEAVGHQQAAEIGVAEAERPVEMAVSGDPWRRVTRMVDEDFLRHEEHSAGR